MPWYVPFQLSQMVIAVVFTGVFIYLFRHDQKPYLLDLVYSWGSWSCMYFLTVAIYNDWGPSFLLTAASRLCWLLGGILLVVGVFRFISRPFPTRWYMIACAVYWFSLLALGMELHVILQLAPVFFFIGYTYIRSGTLLLSPGLRAIAGLRPTGLAFYLWGLHLICCPLWAQIESFIPWGNFVSLVLAIITAHGTLIAYYQKIRGELVASEAHLRLLADNAQDVIYRQRFWPELRLDYISPSVTRMTGYEQIELYTDHELAKKMVHPEDLPRLMNNLPTERTNVKTRWVHKDGSIRFMDMNVGPVFDDDGVLIAVEGIARDVTDQMRAEQEVIRMQEARQRLLSNISHDLRSPMTSIQGYLEALLDGVVTKPEDQQRYLRVIHARVLGLKRLIQDLFELARLEQRQISFNFRDIALESLFQQISERFKLDVTDAGLSFQVEHHCLFAGWLVVRVDLDRVDQVFGNLVSNAIRHARKGGCLRLGIASCNETDVILYLEDDGSGISESDAPFVFERFYKASKSRNQDDGGSGLGLAIAKEITESHGGNIWVESVPGAGATFYIRLPLIGSERMTPAGIEQEVLTHLLKQTQNDEEA